MKNAIIALALAASLAACTKTAEQKNETAQQADNMESVPAALDAADFTLVKDGDAIDPTGALTVDEAASQMEKNGTLKNVKITGTVTSVCQVKGCWMKVQLPSGEQMHVTFKDYSFFVPKDSAEIVGRQVVMQGEMYRDTTAVEDLRHYAHDAGKSEAEQAKITEPKVETKFDAQGVLIAKQPAKA